MTVYISDCKTDDECPKHLACKSDVCKYPCEDFECGINAYCKLINHIPICKCPDEYPYPLPNGEAGGKCSQCNKNGKCPDGLLCHKTKCLG